MLLLAADKPLIDYAHYTVKIKHENYNIMAHYNKINVHANQSTVWALT